MSEESRVSFGWDVYRVTIEVEERLIGGIPVVPEGADRASIYEAWARGQGVQDNPDFEKPLVDALVADPDMPIAPVTTDDVEGLQTGFKRDGDGLYIEARQVKAMIRESSQRLGLIKTVRGSRQVLQHDLHVRAPDGSQKIRLGTEAADGKDMRPISVVTRQGPRTALKRFEFMNAPTLVFDVCILVGGVGSGIVNGATLHDVLDFGGWLGLGADRSQGEGVFTISSCDKIADNVRDPRKVTA